MIYVGGLRLNTRWQEVKDHMKKAGNVEFADVLLNKRGTSKGVAWVQYGTEAEAQKAVAQLHGSTLEGNVIVVDHWRRGQKGWTKVPQRADSVGHKQTGQSKEGIDHSCSRSRRRSCSRSWKPNRGLGMLRSVSPLQKKMPNTCPNPRNSLKPKTHPQALKMVSKAAVIKADKEQKVVLEEALKTARTDWAELTAAAAIPFPMAAPQRRTQQQ